MCDQIAVAKAFADDNDFYAQNVMYYKRSKQGYYKKKSEYMSYQDTFTYICIICHKNSTNPLMCFEAIMRNKETKNTN